VILPIVLVSPGTNHGAVAAWRDMGGNDVIVKPVSLETVENRLQTLILAPKLFVTAKAFIGPDRRHPRYERRQFGERRPGGEDRRGRSNGAKVFAAPVWAKPEDPVSDT
jgi:hypothetical protein